MYARPRKHRGGGGSGQSLDSLLDTMTNVVGILVIVLVVTLLGVRDAVKRIDASLPDVSQEQLDAQKEEAAQTAALLKTVLTKQDAGPKEPLPDVDALKQKLAALKDTAADDPLDKELSALLKQLADQKKESKAIQDELEKLQKEYQELGTKLRNTPNRTGAVAPSIVQLPNPRPAPPNARPIYVLVKEGRIGVIDVDNLRETLHERVVKAPTAIGAGKLDKAQRDGEKNIEGDRDKLKNFVAQLGLGRPHFNVTYRYTHENRWHHLMVQFAERGGESIKQINLPSSSFQQQVRVLKGKPVYFRFLVDRKSFELYLKARQLAERAGIPAGWQLHENKEWATHNHPRIRVIGELPPPPPKPVDPNAPKPKPRAPQNLLD